MVASTHSIEALRTVAAYNEGKTRILLTSLEEGRLEAKEFTLKEVEELWEAGVDVRTAEDLI